jgi:hypothetical protein
MKAETHSVDRQSETTLRTELDTAASQVLRMSNTARNTAACRVGIRRDAALLAQFLRQMQAIIHIGHHSICHASKTKKRKALLQVTAMPCARDQHRHARTAMKQVPPTINSDKIHPLTLNFMPQRLTIMMTALLNPESIRI